MEVIVAVAVAVLLVAGLVVGVLARRGPRGGTLDPPPAGGTLRPSPPPRPPRPRPEPVPPPEDDIPNVPSSGVGVAPRPGDVPLDEVETDASGVEPDIETVAEIEEALASAVEQEQA